jgi:ABC-type branched-subunit amino acid transport system ATPase component
VELALETCETVAVLDQGRIVFNGDAGALMRNARLKEVYLGLA